MVSPLFAFSSSLVSPGLSVSAIAEIRRANSLRAVALVWNRRITCSESSSAAVSLSSRATRSCSCSSRSNHWSTPKSSPQNQQRVQALDTALHHLGKGLGRRHASRPPRSSGRGGSNSEYEEKSIWGSGGGRWGKFFLVFPEKLTKKFMRSRKSDVTRDIHQITAEPSPLEHSLRARPRRTPDFSSRRWTGTQLCPPPLLPSARAPVSRARL